MKSGVRVACFIDASKAMDKNVIEFKTQLIESAIYNNLPIEGVPGTSLVTYALS